MSTEEFQSSAESFTSSADAQRAPEAHTLVSKTKTWLMRVFAGVSITAGSFLAQAEADTINQNVIDPVNRILGEIQGAEYRPDMHEDTPTAVERFESQGVKPIVNRRNK